MTDGNKADRRDEKEADRASESDAKPTDGQQQTEWKGTSPTAPSVGFPQA